MRVDPRQGLLDDVADGEIGPAEAFPLVRELLVEDARKFGRRVYIALQSVVRRLVAGGALSSETDAWSDVCGRAGAMMLQGGEEALSHRVEALVDLIELAARFVEMQPLDEVMRRRHHAEVMRLLAMNDGAMHRASILERLGLGQSNLSRIIATLEGHGLVRREKAGREAKLLLTEAGQARLVRVEGAGAPMPDEAAWQAIGIGVTVSQDGKLRAANDWFERAAGTSAEIALASARNDGDSEDVNTLDDRWVRRIDVGDRKGDKVSVWVDIGDLKLAEIAAHRRLAAMEATIAALRADVAKAEAEAAVAERRYRHRQLMVQSVRERAVGRLGLAATQCRDVPFIKVADPSVGGRPPSMEIVEIRNALDHLLGERPLDRGQAGPDAQDGLSIVKQILQSVSALAKTPINVQIPEWLATTQADYRSLAEPLIVLLLNADGQVEMSIIRSGDRVEFHGSCHRFGGSHRPHRWPDPLAADHGPGGWETWTHGIRMRVLDEGAAHQNAEFTLVVPVGKTGETDPGAAWRPPPLGYFMEG